MQVFENHTSWASVKEACNILINNGYKALLAGGCVRDGLLGRVPKDFDIATNAKPDEVEALFEKTVAVGKSFGVIKVIINREEFDVASFRADGDYVDGRHPKDIVYSDIKGDASRRDFTINAMYFDMQNQKIIDYFDGKKHISEKLIQTVGEPRIRFSEDYLRVLRAVRFSAELGFNVERETWQSCNVFSVKLKKISNERIRNEVLRIINSNDAAKGIYQLQCLGFFETFFAGESKSSLSTSVESIKKFSVIHNDLDMAEFAALLSFNSKSKEFIEKVKQTFVLTANENKQCKQYLKIMNLVTNQDVELGEVLIQLEKHKSYQFLDKLVKSSLISKNKAVDYVNQYNERCTEEGELPKPLLQSVDLSRLGYSGVELGNLLNKSYRLQLEAMISKKQQLLIKLLK